MTPQTLLILSLVALHTASARNPGKHRTEDKEYWLKTASDRLDEVLNRREMTGAARNVIVFLGDGMGLPTITAARIQKGGESHVMPFEKFPATGLSKTYNVNKMVSDSASTATAIFTGVKTTKDVVGLDSKAEYNKCDRERNGKATVSSFMEWAQETGRDTGIVTTMRITHDSPASTYAHINNKKWECDSKVPEEYLGCVKDVARQLAEDTPGKNFKVILGGGRNEMGDDDDDDDGRGAFCRRKDGRNLAVEWTNGKPNSVYVRTAEELSKVDVDRTEYLLGLFAAEHMNYTAEEVKGRPSLKLMTETAIRMLRKNRKGFALMVEGGLIDYGHHVNMPGLALPEVVDFGEAVDAAARMTDVKDTLIIVTADHSHTMTLNGYPDRGSDIFGVANGTCESYQQTLTYANGPGFVNSHVVNPQKCGDKAAEEGNGKRSIYQQHSASVYRHLETHGGEDVPIYASGPMSHLLVGVHEQNYIASVISYAMCSGPEAHRCR